MEGCKHFRHYCLQVCHSILCYIAYFSYDPNHEQMCVAFKTPNEEKDKLCHPWGLSTFLILCYAQSCVQTSFRLLLSIRLHGIKGAKSEFYVHFYGSIRLFYPQHLPYAIPALLCIFAVVSLPPIILIWHPFGKGVLSKFGFGESILVKVIDKILFIRIGLIAVLLFAHEEQFYVGVAAEYTVILTFHALMQPYKKRLHNVIDALLFSNILRQRPFTVH